MNSSSCLWFSHEYSYSHPLYLTTIKFVLSLCLSTYHLYLPIFLSPYLPIHLIYVFIIWFIYICNYVCMHISSSHLFNVSICLCYYLICLIYSFIYLHMYVCRYASIWMFGCSYTHWCTHPHPHTLMLCHGMSPLSPQQASPQNKELFLHSYNI